MEFHFWCKVAYYRLGSPSPWIAAVGAQLLYIDGPADEPPPEGIFALYITPGQTGPVHVCTHLGSHWKKVNPHPGGYFLGVGPQGVGGLLLTEEPYPSEHAIERPWVLLADGDGWRADLLQAAVKFVTMAPGVVRPLERFLVTDSWDNPQGWAGANLTHVDFRGMGDILPRVSDWSRADMSGAKFDGLDLREVGFDGEAKLAGASLREVNLEGRDFGAANLDGADLSGAKLAGGNFANASMIGTMFDGSDLTDAYFGQEPRFSGDVSRRTSFRAATLDGVELAHWAFLDLRGTSIVVTNAPPLDARHVDLRGAKVEGELTGANFDDGLLSDADLSGAEMVGARFNRAIFGGTQLPATLDDCSFVEADLSHQLLSSLSLRRVDLTKAQLVDASLGGADLTAATLDEAECTRAGFLEADLSSATLRRTVLHSAVLSSARMVGTDCTEAQLGATKSLFWLPAADSAAFSASSSPDELFAAFAEHGVALTRQAKVTQSEAHGGWLIKDGDETYLIASGKTGTDLEVRAYLSTDQAAVMTSCYMPNAVFDQADLYAVNMSSAHWYGSRASAVGANLEQIDASNANFGQISLVDARLMGAGLSSAILVGANLRGAQMGLSAGGRQTSLNKAHLAGADLTSAALHNAVVTDAAVSVDVQGNQDVSGVPLFTLDSAFGEALDGEEITAGLRDAFVASGYRLADDAEVELKVSGAVWEIHQGHEDPQQLASRYAHLAIVRLDDGLHVHGSALWITRINDDGQLETIKFSFRSTQLTEQEMNESTICPNGKSLLANKGEGAAWYEMMTAYSRPPVPPECIPSPDNWC